MISNIKKYLCLSSILLYSHLWFLLSSAFVPLLVGHWIYYLKCHFVSCIHFFFQLSSLYHFKKSCLDINADNFFEKTCPQVANIFSRVSPCLCLLLLLIYRGFKITCINHDMCKLFTTLKWHKYIVGNAKSPWVSDSKSVYLPKPPHCAWGRLFYASRAPLVPHDNT